MDYSEQEIKFVEVFLEESRNSGEYRESFAKAKAAAGYPEYYTKAKIFGIVKDLLIEGVGVELAQMIPKMLNKLEEITDNPSTPGAANVLKAAETLLDRAGIIKVEKSEIKVAAPNGVLVLPAKQEIKED